MPDLETQGRRYENTALIVVLMGVMMTAVDTTAVVLGLPVMMLDLSSDMISMIWVIMAYLLVITIFGTQVGRLGDMHGRVRLYNVGFAVFTSASLLCGFAQNGSQLIGFRILQGLGGAMVFSNSGAIIADTVSLERRGRAYGLAGVGYSLGAISGILLGGIIITFLSWRYIFFINVPLGIAAVVVSYKVLRERSPKLKRRIDYPGMALMGVGLLLVLYALTEMTGSGWTTLTGIEILAGFLLLTLFAVWEKVYSDPLLDLSLLSQRVLTASILAAFFQAIAGFAVLFLVIMYLQGVRGLSPLDASLVLVPGYLLGGLISPFSGRMSDRLGARYVATLGLALQAVGILVYSSLTVDSAFWIVVAGAVINGSGSNFFFPANSSAVMASAPRQSYGIASGLLRTFSNVGMVSSFALALLVASLAISRQLAFQIFLGVNRLSGNLLSAYVSGMHEALLVSIGLLLVAAALSVLRGKEARTSMQQTQSQNSAETR